MSAKERSAAAPGLEQIILMLAAERGPGKSLDPADVAKAALPGDPGWARLMPHVRAAAVHLARTERLVILRKGKPADPENFRGVYRLALPPVAEAQGAGNSADVLPVTR